MDKPTKKQIAKKLKKLSLEMIAIAGDMDNYGFSDEEWKLHTEELYGAAYTAMQWSETLREE